MSQENVETACQAAEAIDRRDRTAWLAFHHDDCEVLAMDDWPERGVRGAEAAWNFYGTVFDALDRVGRSGIGDLEPRSRRAAGVSDLPRSPLTWRADRG
jgi:hypothetical protein